MARTSFHTLRFSILPSLAFAGLVWAGPASADLRGPPVIVSGMPPCTVKAPVFPCGALTFQAGASTDAVASMTRGAGAHIRHAFVSVPAVAAVVPDARALRQLQSSGVDVIPDRHVRFIEPLAGKGRGGGGSGGGGELVPEGVARIGAHLTGNDGAGVGVAIVDTGLDLAHADLDLSNTQVRYFDAFGGDCQDQNGHGTHVGGTVAARRNGLDVLGVAPGATLYCVRVLEASGSGSDSTIMAGLDWIWTQNGGAVPVVPLLIAVANASLGRPGSADDNPALAAIVRSLAGQGVSLVVAAGNDAGSEISARIPAAYPEVMAVASTTARDGSNACRRFSGFVARDTASYFSTDGAGVAISAPGETQEDINKGCMLASQGILSLAVGGGTTRMSGTSMAAPHVAGVVAQMLAVQPGITPACVRLRLQRGAELPGSAPLDSPAGGYSFDGVREGCCRHQGH